MTFLAVLAEGGLLSVLLFAGFGAGMGLLILGGRRGAGMGAFGGALLIAIALFPSPVFRAQMGESVVAVFWLSLFLFPIVAYALAVREVRRRARAREAAPDQTPTPGLRLIEDDEAFHADQLARLMELNARAPGFWRDRFSLAWRSDEGEIIGGLRVTITMGLAEINVLYVDEKHRGRGIGAALLQGAEEEAKRRGASRAMLHTFSWQVPEFYRRLGWNLVRAIPLDAGSERLSFEKTL